MNLLEAIWDIITLGPLRSRLQTRALLRKLQTILQHSTHIDYRRTEQLYELCKTELQKADEGFLRVCRVLRAASRLGEDVTKDSIDNRIDSVLGWECMRRDELKENKQ